MWLPCAKCAAWTEVDADGVALCQECREKIMQFAVLAIVALGALGVMWWVHTGVIG